MVADKSSNFQNLPSAGLFIATLQYFSYILAHNSTVVGRLGSSQAPLSYSDTAEAFVINAGNHHNEG
jgi:hypothetical protein